MEKGKAFICHANVLIRKWSFPLTLALALFKSFKYDLHKTMNIQQDKIAEVVFGELLLQWREIRSKRASP